MPRPAKTLAELVRQIVRGERDDHFIGQVVAVAGNQVTVQRIGYAQPITVPSARGVATTLSPSDTVYVVNEAGSYHVAHAIDS